LREVIGDFGIVESDYSKQLIDYWDGNRSAFYLLAVRSVAGWLDFLPALSTRVILDRGEHLDQKSADPIDLQHHAYFEAMTTLGDSLAAGLAGHPRAAFALIRPFLELATAEVYVNEQEGEERLHNFLAYLRGVGHRPRFEEMLTAIFAEARYKALGSLRDQLRAGYSAASAGVHVQSVEDSRLDMRDGNRTGATFAETTFWLASLSVATQRMLALLTLRYPMVLFPVDRERTFGFSGPIGVVVDAVTAASVAEGLGDRHASALRSYLEMDPDVISTLEWFRSQPLLTDAQIEASWSEYLASHPHGLDLQDAQPMGRAAFQRASLGGAIWALDRAAAMKHIAELPDFDPEEALGREILATELRPFYRPPKRATDEG
jgi:hypothetical protein